MAAKRKRVTKKVIRTSRVTNSTNKNNFLLILACSTLILGSVTIFMFGKPSILKRDDNANATQAPNYIGWKTFNDGKYYFKYPAGMLGQVIVTENSKYAKTAPVGFKEMSKTKIVLDGQTLDEVFYKSTKDNTDIQVRVVLSNTDYLSFDQYQAEGNKNIFNSILSTFEFKE